TVLDEIVGQVPGTGTLVVVAAGGGGGLLAGIALRARDLATRERPIHIAGVESAVSHALSASVAAGHVVQVPVGDTIADGLAGNLEAGSITVDLLRELGPALVAVTDEQIHEAIRYLARQHGVVAEGAGAAAVAAIRSG